MPNPARVAIALPFYLATILLTACSSPLPPIQDCQGNDRMMVFCGYQNPEDLALAPGGDEMIVSQFGSMDGAKPGNMAISDFAGHFRVVFEGGGIIEPTPGWGAEDCPGGPAPEFSPHGIDLTQRTDGKWQLLVVNHGGREAVEFFEVTMNGATTGLAWRGCVSIPQDIYLNDVVNLDGGGFWATHMYPRSSTFFMIASLLGGAYGHVVQWTPDGGLTRVPGTEGSFPNGIEKSADEKFIFVNHYTANQVVKFDVEAGQVVGSTPVSSPDNIAWDRDGRHLLVASHRAELRAMLACQEIQADQSCAFPFDIVRIDSEDMSRETAFSHPGGPPMGAATVALVVDDYIFLGTFAGNRIGRIDHPR